MKQNCTTWLYATRNHLDNKSPPISDLTFSFKKITIGSEVETKSWFTVTESSEGERKRFYKRERGGSGTTYGLLFGFDPTRTKLVVRQSIRSKRLRSRVAESSNVSSDCFFVIKDGRGSALGDGDIANADPAYMSFFAATNDESSDWPLRRIVTFSTGELLLFPVAESSALDLFETDAVSSWKELLSFRFLRSGRATCFRWDLEVVVRLL